MEISSYLWMIDVFIWSGFIFCFVIAWSSFVYLLVYIPIWFAPRKLKYKMFESLAKNEPKTFMKFELYVKRKYGLKHETF